MKHRSILLAVAATVLALVGGTLPARAVGEPPGALGTGPGRPLTVTAGQPQQVPFVLLRTGEALLDLSARAPGVSWGVTGHESAVVSADVDGRYVTDVVVPSAVATPHQFFLGRLGAGTHRLTLRLATDRSRGGTAAVLTGVRFHEVTSGSPDYVVAAHAPVLYGRTLAQWGGAFQNAWTDVPLIAWHQVIPNPDGSYQLWYTIAWSNEDGGTGLAPASLMARWGRTFDIEWIYQVGVYRLRIDPAGNVVPGSEYFQAPQHGQVHFAGRYEDKHPILQTCTDNNNVCDQLDATAQQTPMRFTLSAQQEQPLDEAREVMMDRSPWTYWVTAQEMIREGKVEQHPDPATPDLSDERNYLYLVLKKTTVPDQDTGTLWIGATVAVKLKGDPTVYRSDHAQQGWSLRRDDPAATTVELPPGTTADRIEQISVLRVSGQGDTGGSIQLESIERAMFLDSNYLPERYFISDHPISAGTLTPQRPQAVVWTAPA